MQHAPQPRSSSQQIAVFSIAMAVYLIVVHVWSFKLPLLPRDVVLLADPDQVRGGAGAILAWQRALFGAALWPWRVQNLLLLYACMQAIFFLTRFVLQGPWWLGSFAAVLFMAHPATSEAKAGAAGVVDLLPALFALGCLALHAAYLRIERRAIYAAALAALAASLLLFPKTLPLFLLIVLMEVLLAEDNAPRRWRVVLTLAVGAMAMMRWRPLAPSFEWEAATLFAPLYTAIYPLGLLPETVETYRAYPLLGWGAGILAVAAVAYLYRATGRRAFIWAIFAAAGARLLQVDAQVDLVTFAGGSALLVPLALAHIGWAALCQDLQQLPPWRKPVVYLTTLWCAVYFVLQVQWIFERAA